MENPAEAVELLVQFRAGRMVMAGTTVKPDPRKGLLRMIRADDMLVHLQWLDRSTGAVEEDVIIFPEEATFAKVGQAKGRVYLLSFAGDGRKLFFWMQEPNADDDERLCAHVNQRLNEVLWIEDDTDDEDDHMEGDDDDGEEEEGLEVEEEEGDGKPDSSPQVTSAVVVPPAAAAAAAPPSAAQISTEQQTQGAPQPPAATAQPIAAAAPPATAPPRPDSAAAAAAAAAAAVREPARSVPAAAASPFGSLNISAAEAAAALAASLQMGQLRNLVSGLSQIAVPAEIAAAAKAAKEPSLSELLQPASMVEVLQAHDVQERLRDLLPPALQSATEMQQLVQSPQFQQQLDTLSLLLRTGRIDLAQFGINAVRYGPGVVSFLEAIQDQVPAAAPAAPPAPPSATAAATPPAPGATATDQTTMDVDPTVGAAPAKAAGAAAAAAAGTAAAGDGGSDSARRAEAAGAPAAPQDGKGQHRVESQPDGPPGSGS